MSEYCVTAANHQNLTNHVASSFRVWELNKEGKWASPRAMSAREVVALIEAGHSVRTAQYNTEKKTISLGEPVEVELRIAKNMTKYDITNMPTF